MRKGQQGEEEQTYEPKRNCTSAHVASTPTVSLQLSPCLTALAFIPIQLRNDAAFNRSAKAFEVAMWRWVQVLCMLNMPHGA